MVAPLRAMAVPGCRSSLTALALSIQATAAVTTGDERIKAIGRNLEDGPELTKEASITIPGLRTTVGNSAALPIGFTVTVTCNSDAGQRRDADA